MDIQLERALNTLQVVEYQGDIPPIAEYVILCYGGPLISTKFLLKIIKMIRHIKLRIRMILHG